MDTSITIICLHGVGLWPGLFEGLEFGAPTLALTRPGYGTSCDAGCAVVDLAGNVEAVAAAVATTEGAVLVGVSGGATIALACALEHIEGLVAVVTHEPLVGALEPEIDDRVAQWATELETEPGAESSLRFLEALYGRTSWQKMPRLATEWADDHAAIVCREVRHFSAFQPSVEEIATVRLPHLTTVGRASPPARHRVAAMLGRGGADVAVIGNSAHHVLIDRPAAFSASVRTFLTEVL